MMERKVGGLVEDNGVKWRWRWIVSHGAHEEEDDMINKRMSDV